MEVKFKDLLFIYEHQISKNVKNKKKLLNFERNKFQNLINIYYELKNNNYRVEHYNIFLIREPKKRIVMSLSIHDKIINHYVTEFILKPKLEKYLDHRNIATRKNMGSDYGIKLVKKYLEQLKKYDQVYVLKIDISKYFYKIDHEILLEKLACYIKDKEILDMIKDPILISIGNTKIDRLTEKALKKYILENIEKILLELGIGFCFVGSEQKIKVGNNYRYIDLVFFNYELNCFVLIELKINKLDIKDIGQLEFYVNYYDTEIKKSFHNPTLGIIICKKNDPNISKYINQNILVSSYELIRK